MSSKPPIVQFFYSANNGESRIQVYRLRPIPGLATSAPESRTYLNPTMATLARLTYLAIIGKVSHTIQMATSWAALSFYPVPDVVAQECPICEGHVVTRRANRGAMPPVRIAECENCLRQWKVDATYGDGVWW